MACGLATTRRGSATRPKAIRFRNRGANDRASMALTPDCHAPKSTPAATCPAKAGKPNLADDGTLATMGTVVRLRLGAQASAQQLGSGRRSGRQAFRAMTAENRRGQKTEAP